jgi:ATP-dependent exoDNAse (exonuclease V) beta subunit
LLWKLHHAGVPALIVGDLKQSIMGFQSADPRLMGNLIEQHRAQCAPLESNWRSQTELMKVINAFGGQLFDKDYAPLTPKAPYQSNLHPLEVIHLEGTGIKNQTRAQHVAARVKDILSDEKLIVFDRYLKQHRPIRGEDIAILGMTHSRLKGYADALHELGIRARLAQDGWFMSREIQLAYYGLSFVADPQDRHAALYLSVTELGEDDLTSAVRTLLQGDELPLPLLQRLKYIARRQSDLTVDELVTQTLDAMALFDLASTWLGANQVRANLLRLIGEAHAFVAADREALAGGGYHGSGLKTFIAWLGRQLEGKDGDRQPDAQVHDEEAVQLQTWHAAKGKEWPVVIVATLNRKVEGKLPSLDIQFTDFSDLKNILENARLEFSPSFAAAETNDNFKTPLDEKARAEGLNLLYVALTRAREQLILEWETNLQNSSSYTYWHLLRDVGNVKLEGNKLLIGETSFPCRVIAADREPPQIFKELEAEVIPYLPRIGRRALKFGDLPDDLTPLFMTPSRLHGQVQGSRPRTVRTIAYGPPLELSLLSGADRGLLIHRALELMGQGVVPEKAKKLLELSVSDADWFKIQEMAASFTQCLHEQFKPTSLHWEVPITSKNLSGSVISGTIDLLVETNNGFWIIDHKSDEPQNLEETFNHYLPQLNSYAQALSEGTGLKVRGLAVHWACFESISIHQQMQYLI